MLPVAAPVPVLVWRRYLAPSAADVADAEEPRPMKFAGVKASATSGDDATASNVVSATVDGFMVGISCSPVWVWFVPGCGDVA